VTSGDHSWPEKSTTNHFGDRGASRDRGANAAFGALGAEGSHLFDRHFPALLEGAIWRNCLRRSTASADRRWLASGHGWARFIMVLVCLAIVRRRGAVSPEPAAAHFHTYFKQGRIPCLFLPIVIPIVVSRRRLGNVLSHAPPPRSYVGPEPGRNQQQSTPRIVFQSSGGDDDVSKSQGSRDIPHRGSGG
jgi:hypothetical protein